MSELCEITSSKRIFAADYKESGVPFFRGREVTEKYNGALTVSTELFIDRSKFEEIKAKHGAPMPDDLLLTSVGTLGSIYVVREGDEFYFKDGNLTWFRKLNGIASRYLYYWLGSDAGKAELKKCTIGSSQSAFTIVLLKGMEIDLPPLEEQRRIAGILSAYDDLIENCRRRIVILEEMARALYREWFVHFRYPGHESIPLTPSPLGPIPQGWEAKTLKDVCHLTMGQSPKSEFYNSSGEGFPFHQGVSDFGTRFPTDRLYCTAEGRMAKAADILFSVRAPVGRLNIANKPVVLGRGLSALRHRADLQALLWEQLKDKFTEVDMIGNGAIFASVTKTDMERIELVVPVSSLATKANEVLESLHRSVATVADQVRTLQSTRDLLLPKLVSPSQNESKAVEVDQSALGTSIYV